MTQITRAAVISGCGAYRYALLHDWADPDHPTGFVLWVMLNPSTADATQDDPTIRKCRGFTTRWGFSRMVVVNLFGYRATKPSALLAPGIDPVGPMNLNYANNYARRANLIVAAWGSHRATMRPGLVWRIREILRAFGDIACVGRCRDGDPRHPLMAPYIDAPEIWERGAFQDRDPVPLDWASIQDGSDYPGLKLPRPDSATITQNRGPDVK